VAIRTWVDDARYYRSLGLSVIPVTPHDKQPITGFKWKEYQTRIPTEDELAEWAVKYPDANLAIICGKVSHGLHVCDIDSIPFCTWIRPHLPSLNTLVIETGSDKLHVFLFSTDHPSTTAYNDRAGMRVADIKGEGSYVVVPPSTHPSGGSYRVLMGDFEHIRSCANARQVYDRLYAAYSGTVPTAVPAVAPPAEDFSDRTIIPPLVGADYEKAVFLLEHLALTSRVKRAIFDPLVEAGVGEWARTKSNSEIDFAVCAQLDGAGLTAEQIEVVFATFPIGSHTYQERGRPNHGRGYVLRTIHNVHERVAAKEDAKHQEVGRNFKLLRVRRIEMDDPQYELDLEVRGEERTVTLNGDDLFEMNIVTRRMGVQLNFVPQFGDVFMEKGGGKFFAEAIFNLAEKEEVPESATQTGVIKFGILKVLRGNPLHEIPESPAKAPTSWYDDARNLLIVNGDLLVNNIGTKLRPAPAAHQIWQTLRSMGGGNVLYQFPDGSYWDLWYLPFDILL
jgi:hypothetical protein